MKQRLGIAIALLNHPKLLILDEPTNGLDPIGIEELRKLIRSFPKQGITVILSSHILSEVEQVVDEIGIISNGVIGYQGEVSKEQNLEKLFMKVVAENRKRGSNMERFIRVEFQKMKGTFGMKLIWIVPVFCILLCGLGGGQNAAFNWWYTTFLPGALTLISSLIVLKDEKSKYRGILPLPIEMKDVWAGKMIYCIICCSIASIISAIGVVFVGIIYKETISIGQNIIATILIILLFMWQIPLCMFLASKFGIFVTVLTNMFFTIVGVAVFSTTEMWYVFPYSIPSRLMVVVLHILPNGLPVPEGSELLNNAVILPGVLISVILFVLFALVTRAWFNNREVK